MIIDHRSHLDHGLSAAHIAHILKLFKDRKEFFLVTIPIPDELPSLPCNLHGPIMGDGDIPEWEVHYKVRGNRKGESRMMNRAPRMVRNMTVIAGPDGDTPCVLYTAFGGPSTPKEPWDGGDADFWSRHALSE